MKHTMKRPPRFHCSLALFLITFATPLFAQESTTATAKSKFPPISAEELTRRKNSIPEIEERIKDREEQLQRVVKNMESTNAHMEERIAKIVAGLKSIKDSQDSRVRVAKLKNDTIEALFGTIERYKDRRNSLKEMIRQGQAPVGEGAAEKGIDAFDKKIDRRVGQIIELSKSFTEHKDYKKYELESHGHSWESDYVRKSEKWKQNRRETVFTDQQRKHVIKGLEDNIKDLETKSRSLKNNLSQPGLSETLKAFYQEDLERNEAILKSRIQYLGEVMKPNHPHTESVGQRRAHDTELMVKEIAKDIKKGQDSLSRDFYDVKNRLKELQDIKTNLAARKEWLQKYEEANGTAKP